MAIEVVQSGKKLEGSFYTPADNRQGNVGNIVRKTRSGRPVMLVQLNDAAKKIIADLLDCSVDQLANSEGHFYARINLPCVEGRDPDTGLPTFEFDGVTKDLAALKRGHYLTMSFTNVRPRAYKLNNGPFAGQFRVEAIADIVDVTKASPYNLLDMPKGSITLDSLRAQAERQSSIIANAAEAAVSAAEQNAAVSTPA